MNLSTSRRTTSARSSRSASRRTVPAQVSRRFFPLTYVTSATPSSTRSRATTAERLSTPIACGSVVSCDQPGCKHIEPSNGRSITVRVQALIDHIHIVHFDLGVSGLPTNAFLVAKAVEGKSKACRYCGRVFSGDHFVRNSNRHDVRRGPPVLLLPEALQTPASLCRAREARQLEVPRGQQRSLQSLQEASQDNRPRSGLAAIPQLATLSDFRDHLRRREANQEYPSTAGILVKKAVKGESKPCPFCGRVFTGDHYVRNYNRHVAASREHGRCLVNEGHAAVLKCRYCPKLFTGQHRNDERKRHEARPFRRKHGYCKVYKKCLKATRRSGPSAIPPTYTCSACGALSNDKNSDNRRRNYYTHRVWKCQTTPSAGLMKLTKTAVVACDRPHCDYVEVADGRSVTVRVRALFHHIDILHFAP
ncbi:hypothetical protein A1Q1_05088 [Trichosporon asahii var. asahii CBS 2479]|uniref:Uncharacterized protein n=1 Tax=Trichosporon asahii var. asahii (strain ATCC 90039 / CBS 2479 / JCM 2466 / KCTC 7840 / NBRC 103889/ NCYC 2677 / UAMH 7654) TaxID=1186058 RepID=J6EPB5_TRIAS|nr:hypothetical protein A1Q1_05088 [Trichosporon asahii var. asahii CBS 2479]EJT46259.1 hypothetical protein A1Q1_05088 [Trichosporon asahii var. asahii CBS 2479]